MDTTEIPFNKYIGIRKCDDPSEFEMELPATQEMTNHLGTVHASAQFALAEACSGEFLLRKFSHLRHQLVPVVRKTSTKYKKPGTGRLSAKASISVEDETTVESKLEQKGRVLLPVEVKILDDESEITMTATIHWYIQKLD